LSTRVRTPACALAELGRCPAPCEHEITPEEYAAPAPPRVPVRTPTRPPPDRGRPDGPNRFAVRPAAVRGGRRGPLPAGRAAAGNRPDAAAGRRDPAVRTGRRPPRRDRRAG